MERPTRVCAALIAILTVILLSACGMTDDDGASAPEGELSSGLAATTQAQHSPALLTLTIDGEQGQTIDVGDLLSDEQFVQTGSQDFSPFERDLPVRIIIRNSSDITVNIEDIVGDDIFLWARGQADVSNLSGGSAGKRGPGAHSSQPLFDLHLPVEIIIEDSTRVTVDIEDILGDVVVARSGEDASVSNLAGAAHGRFDRFAATQIDLPVDINVDQSRDILVDLEDLLGDAVFASAGGSTDISNLGAATVCREHGKGFSAKMPVTVDVAASDGVEVDVEDIFGDNDIVTSEGDVTVSNLGGPPTRRKASADGAVLVEIPVSLLVRNSSDVAFNIEDIFGDNDLFLLGDGRDSKRVVVDVGVRVKVIGSDGVQIDIEDILGDNDFVLSEDAGEPLTLPAPGRYARPGGVLVLRAKVRRTVAASRNVDISIASVFGGNTAGGSVDLDNSTIASTSQSPTPEYSGARAGQTGAFKLVLNAGPRLAANPEALAAIERAARRWESALDDPITVAIDVGLSDWLPAGIVAQAHTPQYGVDYALARLALTNDAWDEAEQEDGFDDLLTTALPVQLEALLPSGVSINDQLALTPANAKALGFPDLNGAEADAAIVFSSSADVSLEAAALHEIGHALGFLSAVDAINRGRTRISPTALDLYRFEAGGAFDPSNVAHFRDYPRQYIPGRTANFDSIDAEYGMATGETTCEFPHADGYQARHWTPPPGRSEPTGAMVANFSGDASATLSCADLRALDLIGYEVDGCR